MNIVLSIYYTSVQKPLPAQIISLMRGLIVIVPVAFIMSKLWELTGVWLAFPAAEILVFILAAVIYCVLKRKDVY